MAKPLALKMLANTSRKCRESDAPAPDLVRINEVPDAPSWLNEHSSITEWNRLAPILVNAGLLTEGSVSALAVLCRLHGAILSEFDSGNIPPGAVLSSYRALVNDFGLTPVALGRVRPNKNEQKKNQFAGNGRRPGL